MIEYKGLYNYGLVIDYNKECIEGKGLAIFLHCQGDKHGATRWLYRNSRKQNESNIKKDSGRNKDMYLSKTRQSLKQYCN